jgi:hypothetical protein
LQPEGFHQKKIPRNRTYDLLLVAQWLNQLTHRDPDANEQQRISFSGYPADGKKLCKTKPDQKIRRLFTE